MAIITTQRTIEFGLSGEVPIEWFQTLTKVWNQAVFYLNWRQHYQRIRQCAEQGIEIDPLLEIECRKVDKNWQLFQRTEIERRIDKTKSWDADNIEVVPVNRIPYRFLTVNPLWATEPPIDWKTKVSAIELRKPFAKMRCDWLKEASIPQVYVNDFIGLVVIPAWEAYQKGQRGKPRYKKTDDLVEAIACESFRGQCDYLGNDWLKLPGLGKVQIYGLDYKVFAPIGGMVDAMTANPTDFPALQAKLDKLMQTARSKLIKADGHDLKKLRKELSDEAFQELVQSYTDRVDVSGHFDKAIEYFSSPGSFKIIRREGKTYLQIGAELPTQARQTSKAVLIETGLDKLIVGDNGLVVDHQDFSKEEKRLEGIDRAMSRCVRGSNAWQKLRMKKRKIEGRIKRSKKAHQAYFASQIATVNGEITINKVEVKATTGLPIPRPDGEGEYLPNGATKQKQKNRLIHDRALGQFVLLCDQQSKRRGRKFSKVEIEAPPSAKTEDNSPSSSSSETVTRKGNGGKGDRLPRSTKTKKQASATAVEANPPEPLKFKPRDRKRERRIG